MPMKEEPNLGINGSTIGSEEQNNAYIKYLYQLRKTAFKVKDFVTGFDDPHLIQLE